MIRIPNIKIAVAKADPEVEKKLLEQQIIAKLKIRKEELFSFAIFKKSVDARKKSDILYVYTVDAEVADPRRILMLQVSKGISETPDLAYHPVTPGSEKLPSRPVVIGTGPAGLFAGLILARYGYRPLLLERGEDVDSRTAQINRVWSGGPLDTESNVQFGEGGAGTFSDGKLTTQIDDPRCRVVLQEFIRAGAPEEILYKNKPHIGTDLLKTTVKNLRREIIRLGGEVRFGSKVTDFIFENRQLVGLEINHNERLDCRIALLAIGHSARDTFKALYRQGVAMSQKPFSIGVRIEHPQQLIDLSQYGAAAAALGLGAADYKLSYHSPSGRSAYTFCMCPGGYVVAAASEEGGVVTNGMSEYKRDARNANSALLVGVGPEDFGGDHPLAGVEFQRRWEHLAFQLGGRDYCAPVQLAGDFLEDKVSTGFGSVAPSYRPGTRFAPLKDCLPPYVIQTMKEAILDFDRKLKGFALPDAILTGVETRSSSPVRIHRDENHLSNIQGLYPVGEGAGYAGGIMSAAVDGIKTAEKLMERFAPER